MYKILIYADMCCAPDCLWARGGQRQRIIGGRVWPIANATWQAMIWDGQPRQAIGHVICGAIVIRKRFVLTAAHCVQHITAAGRKTGRYLVKVGKQRALKVDAGEQVRRIDGIYIHHLYNNVTLEHDIALLQLNASLNLKANLTARITLPEQESPDICLEEPHGSVLVTGWGRKSPLHQVGTRKLRGVILPVISSSLCQQAFPQWPVTRGMVCAGFGRGEKEPCHGDSGGPAAAYSPKRQQWVLVGVISWGGERCAQPDRYSVLTRVSSYVKWMNDTINKAKAQSTPTKLKGQELACVCK